MKLLVTGGCGFIGYHLCKSLLQDNHEVYSVDNISDYYDQNLKLARLHLLSAYKHFKFKEMDISDRESITNIFKNYKPRKVINLAAQASVRYSLINPYPYIDSNLIGFVNLIELCRNYEVENFVYASSSSVYGKNQKIPFNINDRVDKPIALYGATKRANELIAHSYSHLYDLNTVGLRYFTVYGPWGRPDMALFIFTRKILSNEPISVYNNGNMSRDFTYIDDIINGTKSAIDKNYKCEIFNLGNNKSEKLMDLIAILENKLNKKAKINFQPLQPGDVINTCADIDYSREKINYYPKVNINKGIPQFIDWYKEYYNV